MLIVYSLIIFFLGCLLHFTYELSGYRKIFAIFSAVNESVWEHIKIAIVPTLLFFIYYLIFGDYKIANFLVAAAGCLLAILILTPAVFYFFEYLTKKTIIWLDIVEFFLDIFISQYIFSVLILGPNGGVFSGITVILACLIITLIIIATFACTFYPPHNFLFKDSLSGKFGLKATKKHHHRRHH